MKNLRKKLCLLLVVISVIGLVAGCGTKDTPGANEEGKTEFVIGGLGPLSGEAASYGLSVKQGAEIAIEEINAKGGVTVGENSVKLRLEFADDKAQEDQVVTAYYYLMDEKIDALLGTVTSGAGLALMEYTNEDGILQITPSGSAKELTKYENAFRLCFTDPLQGETMADFAVNELGKKKIGVIFNNADEYSTGMKNAFEAKVKELGGEIVASEAFAQGDKDFSTQLTTVKSSGAEILFLPTYYGEVSLITQQAKEAGLDIPLIGGDGWDGVLNQLKDASVVEGAIFLSPFFAADENAKVKEFVTSYEKKYKVTPDQFAADGYDTVYVMAAALEKAASTKSEDLIKAMTAIKVDGLTGTGITFTEDGEPNKGARFIEIKDGKYTLRK